MSDQEVPKTEETEKPPFYSNLVRQIEHKFPRVLNHTLEATPQDQARKFFSNPSLNRDEVDTHKVHDFINSSDGPIYRSDLLNHVKAHTPQLHDTVLQSNPLEWNEEQLPDSNTTVHNSRTHQIIPVNLGDETKYMVNDLKTGKTIIRDSLDSAKATANLKANSDFESMPRFSGLVLPGGKNYREHLVKLPANAPENPEHYDDGDGSVDHLLGIDSNGDYTHRHFPGRKNVLFHHRADERDLADGGKSLHLHEIQSDVQQTARKFGYNNTDVKKPDENVPQFPFSNSWHKLALKHALYQAANGGHDKLTFNTGDQAWDALDTHDDDERVPINEGMRGFYGHIDQDTGEQTHGMLGRYLNDYTRKWGGRVGKEKVSTPTNKRDDLVMRHMRLPNGQIYGATVQDENGNVIHEFDTAAQAMDYIKRNSGDPRQEQYVHSLNITPEMRESILKEGQPLWGDRDILSKSLVEVRWHKGLFGARISKLKKSFVHGHFRTGADGEVHFVSPFVNKDVKQVQTKNLKGPGPITLSPEEDYQVNGVMAQSFRDWFGNFQSPGEQSSVVVDNHHRPLVVHQLISIPSPTSLSATQVSYADGQNPITVYSRQPGTVLDPKMVTAESPFGTAFYFSAHENQVAKAIDPERHVGLHQVGEAHRESVFDTYRNIPNDADGVHGDDPNMPELEHLFKNDGNMGILRDPDVFDPAYRQMLTHHASLLGKSTPCYLRILNPFYLNKPLEVASIRKIVSNFQELADAIHVALHRRVGFLDNHWIQKVEGIDIFTAMNMLKKQSEFSQLLQRAGFDGIIIDSNEHPVYCIFNPSQCKAKTNCGEFNIQTANIFKSSWPDYYTYSPTTPIVETADV